MPTRKKAPVGTGTAKEPRTGFALCASAQRERRANHGCSDPQGESSDKSGSHCVFVALSPAASRDIPRERTYYAASGRNK